MDRDLHTQNPAKQLGFWKEKKKSLENTEIGLF